MENLIERINKAGEIKKFVENAAIDNQKERIESLKRKVLELCPRIKSCAEIVNALFNNNLISRGDEIFYDSYSCWNRLMTDGFHHGLGFYGNIGVKSMNLKTFGIEGGGACGSDVLVSFNDEKIEYRRNGGYTMEDFERKLKRILDEFDAYEKSVNETAERLIEKVVAK